jgi:hypothetical protein
LLYTKKILWKKMRTKKNKKNNNVIYKRKKEDKEEREGGFSSSRPLLPRRPWSKHTNYVCGLALLLASDGPHMIKPPCKISIHICGR